ncbi:MAG: HEAT repeat domain-containing protein [Ardenticatenaceae bacterium]
MKATKQSNRNGTCYMGLDWQGRSDNWALQPNDTLMFCDLRGAVLDNLALSSVEFFGCRLDGTSFRGTDLHQVRFIGCFSSEQSPPTDFRGSVWQDSDAIECHLNVAQHSDQERCASQEMPGFRGWAAEAVEAANKTLSQRNDVRYEGAICLGRLHNPIVAPYLATLLVDREWEVRVATLRALAQLCDQRFRHQEQALLKWIFLHLGDEHILVRETTRELIKTLRPSDEILLFSIFGMKHSSSKNKLAALRAARELLKYDTTYSRLLDLETLHQLLSDDAQEVRQACLSLLAKLDDRSTLPWILETLSDPNQEVRIKAIQTIAWLTEPPPINNLVHLLSDPNQEVRIETLYTLREVDQLRPPHLAQALEDSSPDVLRVARKLLAEM